MNLIDHLDSAARVHRTPCGDGDLVWREWGEGPLVVLQHGGFGSWQHWVLNIAALAAHNRVLAVDLPGLGDSALPDGPPSPENVAAPIIHGLDSVAPDDERFDLVGFSFGGLIAGQVALARPWQLRSLTLVGASGLGLARQQIDLIPRTPDMDAEAVRAAQAHNLRTLLLSDPVRVDELALAVQAHNDACARIKSRRMSLGDSLREALAGITCPLNGIWGERDVTALPHLDERRALLASFNPDLDFRIIPGAGHWVQYEAAEAFNAALLSQLAASR